MPAAQIVRQDSSIANEIGGPIPLGEPVDWVGVLNYRHSESGVWKESPFFGPKQDREVDSSRMAVSRRQETGDNPGSGQSCSSSKN